MGVRLRSGVIVLPWRSRASQAFGPDTTGGCPDAVLASRYRRQSAPPLAVLDVFLREAPDDWALARRASADQAASGARCRERPAPFSRSAEGGRSPSAAGVL